MSTTVPHFTRVDASDSRKMKLTRPILTNPIHFLKEGFHKVFRNYGRTLANGFPTYLRLHENSGPCSSISWIYRTILKESKATSIPNYEGIEMLENRIRERMLEYSRVFNIESAYISLNLRNQAVCSSTQFVEKDTYYAR